MTDLSHAASDQGLPTLAETVLPQASRPDSPDRGKLRVFISYSRDDLEFADQLDAALDICGFECTIDRHGIPGGAEWMRRLGNLIGEADTVVFVLSPASARSKICGWEVEEATRLGKRILPVNCRPLEDSSPPQHLRTLNYIYFYAEPKAPGSGFGSGLKALVAALNTDFDWLREHTRYLQRATEWSVGGRAANRLLSGDDIAEAKAWAARRPKSAPEPTALHLDFIRASEAEAEARSSAQHKQLEAMAAAQIERETALHEREEALKQAADEQHRRARIRNIALVAVSILAMLVGLLGWRAEQQRITADQQRKVAEERREQADEQRKVAEERGEQLASILLGATNIIASMQTQMDSDTKEQAVAVFRTGAEFGDTTSMRNLAASYDLGLGVKQDYDRARELYEKAVAKGDAEAMHSLGMLYANGRGTKQDYGKAQELYEKAADQGVTAAMVSLGLLYNNGTGVKQDYDKARQWYEKAAAQDDTTAMRNLGLLYNNGNGVKQDYDRARQWYEKAAAKDNTAAMVSLGLLYNYGNGVKQDYGKARQLYEKAAEKNDTAAMRNLGLLYSHGNGVKQDYDTARQWYEKAAEKDDAAAMVSLGLLYNNGTGVKQDYDKARQWYEKAAAKDNSSAMVDLGVLYNNGNGVKQDYDEARKWYEKAADKGDMDAMRNLVLLYDNGNGVKPDYDKVRRWHEKAVDKGDAGVKASLEKLLINEAIETGRYADALKLQEALAAQVEAEETKREGKPGKETAEALTSVAWIALFAPNLTEALTAANRAHTLLPGDLVIETNRAHALMFLGHREECEALYLAYKGKPAAGQGDALWERVIAADFAELRKAGLAHPMMDEIEKKLGVSP